MTDPATVGAYFDVVAPLYDAATAEDWAGNDGVRPLLEASLWPGASAVDVGAGTGQTIALLASVLDPARIHAIDVSAGMLAVCRARFPAVWTFAGTIEAFAARTGGLSVDLVTSVGTVEFIADLAGFLAAAASILRPDGRLVFTYQPAIRFHAFQDPELAGAAPGVDSHGAFRHEPGEMAKALGAAGFAVEREIAFVAYREKADAMIYHGVLAVYGGR